MKNIQSKIKKSETIPHFGLRKLSVGLASMLLSTTLFLGNNANTTHAATNNDGDNNENDESVENSQDADDFARPTTENESNENENAIDDNENSQQDTELATVKTETAKKEHRNINKKSTSDKKKQSKSKQIEKQKKQSIKKVKTHNTSQVVVNKARNINKTLKKPTNDIQNQTNDHTTTVKNNVQKTIEHPKTTTQSKSKSTQTINLNNLVTQQLSPSLFTTNLATIFSGHFNDDDGTDTTNLGAPRYIEYYEDGDSADNDNWNNSSSDSDNDYNSDNSDDTDYSGDDPNGTAGQTIDPKDTNATHRVDAPKGAVYVLDPENVSSGEVGPNGHYENPVTHAPVDPKLLWNNNSTLTIHLNTIKNGNKSNVSTHTITVSFARSIFFDKQGKIVGFGLPAYSNLKPSDPDAVVIRDIDGATTLSQYIDERMPSNWREHWKVSPDSIKELETWGVRPGTPDKTLEINLIPVSRTVTINYYDITNDPDITADMDLSGEPLLLSDKIHGNPDDHITYKPSVIMKTAPQLKGYKIIGSNPLEDGISDTFDDADTYNILVAKAAVPVKGSVKYVDDTTKRILKTDPLTGNVGEEIKYTTYDTVQKYLNSGYKLISNNFNDGSETYKKDGNQFEIHLTHDTETVNPDNPEDPTQPINPDDPNSPKWPKGTDYDSLVRQGKQIIDYNGAGDDTPEDNEQDTEFHHEVVVDKVTGTIIQDHGWTPNNHKFETVNTPHVDGYTATKKIGGGLTATPEQPTVKDTIVYRKNGKIIPVDEKGNPISDVDNPTYITDQNDPTKVESNEPVPEIDGYTPSKNSVTPTNPTQDTRVVYTKNPVPTNGTISYIDDTTGNTLKEDNLNGNVGNKITYQSQPIIQTFLNKGYKLVSNNYHDNQETFKESGNTYEIHFVHATETVTPDNPKDPKDPINPKDPNSPKWPDGTKNDALNQSGSQIINYSGAGSKTPKQDIQTTKFSHSVVVDKVTGKIIKDNGWQPANHTFDTVHSPKVDGYHVNKNIAGGITATPDKPNVTDNVTYIANGKIIPVTPDGKHIPNVPNPPYETDPNDPSKVKPDEPVPKIPGYTPKQTTVTPDDPATDTTVVYTKDPIASIGQVDFIDDITHQTLRSDPLHGNVGDKINYNSSQQIQTFIDKGYKLVSNNFKDGQEFFKDSENKFEIHFVHDTETITPDKPKDPKDPINPKDPNGPKWPEESTNNALNKTGTQTITYTGADSKTPSANIQTTKFSHSVVVDKVTGKVIKDNGWQPVNHTFDTVHTPKVDGYHANKTIAGGGTVSPDKLTTNDTVTYTKNGKIVPITPDGRPIPNVPNPPYETDPNDPSKVKPDEPVPKIPGYTPKQTTVTPDDPAKDTTVVYTKDPTATTGQVKFIDDTIKQTIKTDSLTGNVGDKINYNSSQQIQTFINKGYKLVSNNFEDGHEFFKDSENNFEIHFIHDTETVTPDKPKDPKDPINPKDPNGPKWPEESTNNALNKTGTQTITYTGADSKTPSANIQTTKFSHSVVVDKVTGKVIKDNGWQPANHTFDTVHTPKVDGYHANKTIAGGGTVSPDKLTTNDTVTYTKNGKIVPITPDGRPIPNVPNPPYETDPNNPTKVKPNEPVPKIPGYTPKQTTITPDNPAKDTTVVYTKDPVATTGQIKFIDDTIKQTIKTDSLTGNVGDKINYNSSQQIQTFINKGYKLVSNNFKDGQEIFKESNNNYEVHFVHDTETVTPDKPKNPRDPINPKDPNGPKWPDETTNNALNKIGTQTITYTGADSKTPSTNIQTTKFSHSVVVDKVTGKVIKDNGWQPVNHTFDTVHTPKVDGYHANKTIAGGGTVSPDKLTTNDTVTYTKNGKIVPITPDGKPIPNVPNPPYVTDPNDPSKVKPNEPVPKITGYTPKQTTITPDDPAKDTTVVYTKDPTATTGQVKFIDDTIKQTIKTDSLTGNVGDKINYNSSQQIQTFINKGYKLVSNNFEDGHEFFKDSENNFEIHFIHDTETVTPDKPKDPKDPINPKDPNGPKWPEESTNNALNKTGTQTITYTGADSKTPSANIQTTKFSHSVVVDKVTGKVIKNNGWQPANHTFDTVHTPKVDGYHATKNIAGGLTVSPDKPNVTDSVNYIVNGKIVPVMPDGKPIPNVPNPPYETDPNDPSKVKPNEPVPKIPGYTPKQTTITPNDPAKDTTVVYTKDPVATTGQVKFIDDTTKQTVKTDSLTGNVGDKINYNSQSQIQKMIQKGYKLVSNSFKDGQEIFKDKPNENIFEIHFEHDTTDVTPDKPGKPGEPINPNDPNGSKWPDGTDSDSLKKTGTQTITYKGAGTKTPPSDTQTTTFNHVMTVDKVTGKIIKDKGWTPNKHTFNSKNVPVVKGYHSDKNQAGGKTVTPDNLAATDIVTYSKNGKIIPTDPNGNPLPNVPNPPYETDPNNASKVKPNEPVPKIPGYTPQITQITPDDPSKDTKVIYTKDKVKASVHVKYIDDNTKKVIKDDSLRGNIGDKISYTTAGIIKDFTDKGYELVSNSFEDGQESFTKQQENFEVHFKHGTIDANPDKPGKPGEPINPNDPNGSKWPDNTDENGLTRKGQQIIEYHGGNDPNVRPEGLPTWNRQNVTFKHTVTVDKVTGQIVKDKGWTPNNHTFAKIPTPVVKGWHADKAIAGGLTATPDNPIVSDEVHYIKDDDSQTHVNIVYIDQQTGKPITTKTFTGKPGETINYTTKDTINNYVKQGYKVVNDETKGQPVSFSKTDHTYTVALDHQTEPASRMKTITRTIKYIVPNGSKAPKKVTQILTFKDKGTKDLVTGKTKWDSDKNPISHSFDHVLSPVVPNAKPNIKDVLARKITLNSRNWDTPLDDNIIVTYVAQNNDINDLTPEQEANNYQEPVINQANNRQEPIAQVAKKQPATSIPTSSNNKQIPIQQTHRQQTAKKSLPQTNENNSLALIAIGSLIAGMSTLGWFESKRKKEN